MAGRKVNNMDKWTEREHGIAILFLVIGFVVGMLAGVYAEQPEIIEVYQDPGEKSDLFNFVAGDKIQTSAEYNRINNNSYSGTVIGIDGNLIGFYDENTDTLKAMDEAWLEWS